MMPKKTVDTKYFEFSQNNSGGSFDINDERGIGPKVWIEALSADDANERAQRIGIYFDGCSSGQDCSCCGDRWYPKWRDDGEDAPEIVQDYAFNWHDTVYVHHLNGGIDRIKAASEASPQEGQNG